MLPRLVAPVLLLALPPLALAQQPRTAPPIATLKLASRLVILDVVVVDSQMRIVTSGLT